MNYRRFSFLVFTCLTLAVLLLFVFLLSGLEVKSAFSAPKTLHPQELSIVFTKTVSFASDACGAFKTIDIPANTEVTYCFEVTNSGTTTVTRHELVDNELGLLLDEPYTLQPGGSLSFTATVVITTTTINTATWTAFNPGPTDTISATDTATVTVVPAALIAVSPRTLSTTQGPDEQILLSVNIRNKGDLGLEWLLHEETTQTRSEHRTTAQPSQTNSSPTISREFVDSSDSCPLYEKYAGAEPKGFAEFCLDKSQTLTRGESKLARGPSDIAYAHDIGFISDHFVYHYLDDFPGQIVVGNQPARIFGYDFDVTGRILYGLNFDTQQLGTVDLGSGAFAAIGSSIPMSTSEDLTGLTINPTTGEAYAATTDGSEGRIYEIDLNTGAMTFSGGDSTVPFLIDIAMNPEGVMYGHDISTDSIYRIDTSNGEATLIGPTGIDANFAQGMDFDNYDGTLYAWIYEGGGLNQYGIIDLATGLFSMLAIDNPTGEFIGATRTPLVDSCDLEDDVPWLSAYPTDGVVDPGSSDTISVTVDSSNLAAGIYRGVVCVESNDFFRTVVRIPVTLEVESFASIVLKKTVGLSANGCGTTSTLSVWPGTRGYYCYEVTNTGSVPFGRLRRHSLVDSQFENPIIDDLSATLQPGESLQIIPAVGAVIFETIVNTATWTAYNPGPTDQVTATDTARVVVPTFAIANFIPLVSKP